MQPGSASRLRPGADRRSPASHATSLEGSPGGTRGGGISRYRLAFPPPRRPIVQKKRSSRSSSTALMSSGGVSAGNGQAVVSILRAWCSSTRPGSRPTWRRSAAGGPRNARLVGFAPDGRWHTLTFLAALRINALTAALRRRWPDQRNDLSRLRRTVPAADAAARRHRRPRQLWAATAPGRSALRSATPAPNSRSSRPIRPISIRLSRCSDRFGLNHFSNRGASRPKRESCSTPNI